MSVNDPVTRGASARNRLPTVVAMVIATVAVTIGDLIMSQAMRALGPLRLATPVRWWNGELRGDGAGGLLESTLLDIYHLLWRIFGNSQVWLAIACMVTFLVLWMISLSWSDLTFVMPLTALTYVLNAILVGPVLGEHVSPLRWLGTILIAGGVGMVTLERPPDES